MFKVNQNSPGDPVVEKDCQKLKAISEAITHSCNTRGGDSGTPLVIQPDPSIQQCYLIGIHYGKVVYSSGIQENKAVKITR